MSLSIKYPFTQHIQLLHNLGFKFITQEKAWIAYDLTKEIVIQKLPEEVKNWVNEFVSFHDALIRIKIKKGTIVDNNVQDPKYVIWKNCTEAESLQSCYQAQEESEIRKNILLQVKMDFAHPKIRIEQGGSGLKKEEGIFYIQGSMTTYHRNGLSSVFHELSHFITMSEERLKSGDFNLTWPKDPKTFQGTLNELKVVALTETLCQYYKIKKPNLDNFFDAIAEYPDSELFFNNHMHLVSKFSGYTKEDEKEDKLTYRWFTEKENLSPEEAEKEVNYISSQILHRRHKKQVLEAFYKQQLNNKYTIEHVKFMFNQQLPYLK